MLGKLKIRWTLIKLIMLTSILVSLISSIAGVQALLKMNDIKIQVNSLTDEWIPKISKTGELTSNIALFRKSEWEYLEAVTSAEKKSAENGIDEAFGNIFIYVKALNNLITDKEALKLMDAFQTDWDKYSDLHDKFMSKIKAQKNDEASKILKEDTQVLFNSILEKLKKVSDENFKGSLTAKSDSEKILIKTKWFVAGISTICLIFSIILAYAIARSISKKIRSVVSKLEEGSASLNTSTQQISSSSIKLSESVTEQVSAIHETVCSVEEIASKVKKNNISTEQTLVASNANIVVANQGLSDMGELMKSIGQISNGMEELVLKIENGNKEIGEIINIISEISNKTKVINDIVFQTRLLSFNASVEAARAGESGKGFAVVAEEVGKLAQLSGQSSSEISELLQSSVEKVNAIVRKTTSETNSVVSANKTHIQNGNTVSLKCNQSLQQIISNINGVNEKVLEVNTLSSEQEAGLNEITAAVKQLDDATNFNSTIANVTSKEATSLENQMNDLGVVIEELSNII